MSTLAARLAEAPGDEFADLVGQAGDIMAEAQSGFYGGGPGSGVNWADPTVQWAQAVLAEWNRRRPPAPAPAPDYGPDDAPFDEPPF